VRNNRALNEVVRFGFPYLQCFSELGMLELPPVDSIDVDLEPFSELQVDEAALSA